MYALSTVLSLRYFLWSIVYFLKWKWFFHHTWSFPCRHSPVQKVSHWLGVLASIACLWTESYIVAKFYPCNQCMNFRLMPGFPLALGNRGKWEKFFQSGKIRKIKNCMHSRKGILDEVGKNRSDNFKKIIKSVHNSCFFTYFCWKFIPY